MTLATRNSAGFVAAAVLFSACLSLCGQTNQAAARPTGAEASLAAAQSSFRDAQSRYQKEPDNAIAAWQFGRACFDLAEFATSNRERAGLAQQGIAACRHGLAGASNSAPAHYYLGMNLGQLARTKSLGALKLVGEMDREFTVAGNLDERLDYAGPDRHLGVLYRDAPAFGSVGDRSKARQHLQRAVKLAPGYPENRLSLIEAYLKWGERDSASRELKALEKVWPGARAELAGVAWALSWADWETRLQDIKKRTEEPHKPLESPRH
jgi:tetratricopeptide (TPR) repeat protein